MKPITEYLQPVNEAKAKKPKTAKTYRITTTRYSLSRDPREYKTEGTLQELINYFSYTLECGKSYEHEKGNKKINMNPKNIQSLCTNLYNASNNSARNGYGGCEYEWEEIGEVVIEEPAPNANVEENQ